MSMDPPIEERTTVQLIAIVHEPKEWQEEVILQAKNELSKRNISEETQQKQIAKWDALIAKEDTREASRLKKNGTESYTVLEMVILLAFGPFLLFYSAFWKSFSISFLRKEQFNLKLKQYLILMIISFVGWYLYLNHSFNEDRKQRIEEIENIDISKWEKNQL